MRALIAGLIGQPVGIDDLERARRALTQLYIDRGYVNSGVLIPDQAVDDGIVRFRVVEGRLTEIEVGGEGVGTDVGPMGDLHPDFVRDRLALDPEAPFALDEIEERFRLLLQDPAIARLDGALAPGRELGEARLAVTVTPADPLVFELGVDNFDPPSTGTIKGTAGFTLRNSTGFADELSLNADISKGRQAAYARFSVPVTATGLSVFAEAEGSQTRVIEDPFAELDIESAYARGALGLSYDLVRTSTDTLTFDVTVEFKNSKTFIFGDQPFSFSEGVQDGTARASVIRFGQQYLHRGPEEAYSVRSSFSFGVDLFDATTNPDGVADAQFASWLGQAFYVRRFGDISASARAVGQIAFDELLPFEQVELGGADTVRGYRESAITDDSFVFGSVAVTVPVFDLAAAPLSPEGYAGTVSVQPFVSAGTAWGHGAFGERATLVGAGFDVLWSPRPGLDLTLGVGTPLYTDIDGPDSGIEETRAYFSTRVRF